jgi:hypothetical protein
MRRQLHDTQPGKGGVREKYSSGNFKGIRKGSICEHGQIVGGTKDSHFVRNTENKRIRRTHINWLSHKFKIKNSESLNGGVKPNSSTQLKQGVSFGTIL